MLAFLPAAALRVTAEPLLLSVRRVRARSWRPSTFDRYLLGQLARRFGAVIALVVLIMTLENAPRLAADLRHVDTPWTLLGRLTLYLVPEHLAIAVPVATLLACALTARSLAQRGEWQVLAASGLSPARIMAAPMLLGLVAALILLANAMVLKPLGERRLDALYVEIVSGAHGVPLPLGEPVPLDADTTLFADAVVPGAPGTLAGVVVHRGDGVIAARQASVLPDGNGGVAIRLRSGTALDPAADGTMRRVSFGEMELHGHPAGLGLMPGNLRHQLDRSDGWQLWNISSVSGSPLTNPARAALGSRVDAALFCLLLPWLAVALGVPPRRGQGGAGLMLGILFIVLHLQSAALVEDELAAHALAAGVAHLAGWTLLTAALVRFVERRGEGAVDLLLTGSIARLRALASVRPSLTLPSFPAAWAVRPSLSPVRIRAARAGTASAQARR